MLALATTPAIMPRFNGGHRRAPQHPGCLCGDIWHLHAILTSPAAKLDEVKDAKSRMLHVLEETRRFPLPKMIVPPISDIPR